MGTILAWPIVGGSDERIWSQVVVLQDKSHTKPEWFVCISLQDGEQTEADGESLVHTLGQLYQNSEKSVQTLLTALKHMSQQHPEIHLVGLCVTDNDVVGYGYGSAKVRLTRDNAVADLLSSLDHTWKQIAGTLQTNDVIELYTFIDSKFDLPRFETSNFISPEMMENQMVRLQPDLLIGTSVLLMLLQNEDTIIKKDESVVVETPPPLVNQPRNPWWKRFFNVSPEESAEQKAYHRKIILAGWMVLAILIISVTMGAKAKTNQRLEQQFRQLDQQTNQALATAETMKTVDQVKARQIVRDTQDQVKAAQPIFKKYEKWNKQYLTLVNKVDAYYQSIAAEVKVTDIPVWYSLSIAKPGFSGSLMTLSSNQLAVLDTNSNSLLRVSLATKRADIIAGGDAVHNAVALALSATRTYVLRDMGIVEVNMAAKSSQQIIERDADWQHPSLLGTFGGNLYVVDPQAGEIWRYNGTTKQRWLGPGVALKYQDIVSMAIDGEMWMLRSNGQILRYRRGAQVNFQVSGLDMPLGEATYITLSQDQDSVAVLDKQHQRVVVFSKTGTYQKQVAWSGFSSAQAIALSDDGKSLYVLKDSMIYQASL